MHKHERQHVSKRSALRYRGRAKRALRNAIARNPVGLEESGALRFQLLKLFSRVHSMYDVIDLAFRNSPFLPQFPPESPANVHRFRAYLARHVEVTKLLERALELWMLAGGMKLEDNWVPLLIEKSRLAVAERDHAVQ